MEAQNQMHRIEAEQIAGKRHAVQPPKQQAQPNPASPPPSASSSPSHEFSFTISLHPPTAAKILADSKTKSSPTPLTAAIDLSPADDIFFHGHLLPLQFLSHLPVSPRCSTNSLDSVTLPVKELLLDDPNNNNKASREEYPNKNTDDVDDDGSDHRRRPRRHHSHHLAQESRHVLEGKERGKSKSFSLFGNPRSRKHENQQKYDDHHPQKHKSSKFDLLRRYMRFVKLFLSLKNKRGSSGKFLRPQPCSLSGNLKMRPNKKDLRGRRGEFSAPSSMRTSPANSGLLVASGAATPTCTSDSTMEELQAAIQAAIAHCKKSIATDDKIKLP